VRINFCKENYQIEREDSVLNRSSFLVQDVLLNFRRTEQAVLTLSRPIVLYRSVAPSKKPWQSLEKMRLFRSCDAVINTTLIIHITNALLETLQNQHGVPSTCLVLHPTICDKDSHQSVVDF